MKSDNGVSGVNTDSEFNNAASRLWQRLYEKVFYREENKLNILSNYRLVRAFHSGITNLQQVKGFALYYSS